MLDPWVKSTLDNERVWLAPSWQSDPEVPPVNRVQLQRFLTRLKRNCGVNFFVTFTREEDSGMDGAVVAGNQVESYSSQAGFPLSNYVVLAVVRSKRKNPRARQYIYSAGLRVGRFLRRAGLSDADLARILREAGDWLIWTNPDPSPFNFASEVASKIAGELSPSFNRLQSGSASLDLSCDLSMVNGHLFNRRPRRS